MRLVCFLLTLSLFVTGCSERQSLAFESGAIPIVAYAPLFEGSNTAQGEWNTGLGEFLEKQGHTLDQLREVRIVRATLSGADSTGLKGIRSATVQWVGEGHGMEQVGVLNPLPPDPTSVTLSIANDQSGLADLLRSGMVTVVADLDLDADSETDRHVIGSFTLELTLEP